MDARKSRVFAKLFKKDKVVVSRVSDLLKANYFTTSSLADKFVELSQKVWGSICEGNFVWTKDMVSSHFKVCPKQVYCGFLDSNLVATLTFIYIDEPSILRRATWLEKTGNGYLSNHDPSGNAVFGVDLSVVQGSPAKLSDRIILSAILINVIGDGLRGVYLGSRIPSYKKHATSMSVEEYVHGKRKSGKPLDPELYFYMKNGFEIVDIIPGYMEDPDSLDYGVLIRWRNPFYWITKALPFLKTIIRFAGKKLFLRLPEKN